MTSIGISNCDTKMRNGSRFLLILRMLTEIIFKVLELFLIFSSLLQLIGSSVSSHAISSEESISVIISLIEPNFKP